MKTMKLSMLIGSVVVTGLLMTSPTRAQWTDADNQRIGIPPRGLQWQSALYDAYVQALSQKLPLVVYFYDAECIWCERLEKGGLASLEVNTLADKAIFVRVNVHSDDQHKNVSKMKASLEIDSLPTVVILDVGTEALIERGRVVGFHEPARFYFLLSQIVLRQPNNVHKKE